MRTLRGDTWGHRSDGVWRRNSPFGGEAGLEGGLICDEARPHHECQLADANAGATGLVGCKAQTSRQQAPSTKHCAMAEAAGAPGPVISAVTSVTSSSLSTTLMPSRGSAASFRSSLATLIMTPGEIFSFDCTAVTE
jgi:hypothetical protein